MGRQSKETLIKLDDTEVVGDPRRLRITKQDIEKVGYSDGCMGCNAMRADKPAQRHSEPVREA